MKYEKSFTHCHGVAYETPTEVVGNIISEEIFKLLFLEFKKNIPAGTSIKVSCNFEFYVPHMK